MEIKVNSLVLDPDSRLSHNTDAVEVLTPTLKTFRFILSGLLAVSRTFDFQPTPDDYFTYDLFPRGATRVSVCGLFSLRVPRRLSFRLPRPVRILYLDSDLQILCSDQGEEWSQPEVYLKPKEFNEQKELRTRNKVVQGRGALGLMGQGLLRFMKDPVHQRSPFKVRDRLASFFKEATEDAQGLVKRSPLGSSGESSRGGSSDSSGAIGSNGKSAKGGNSAMPDGGGLIGEVAFSANDDGKVAWATEDDLLGQFQDDSEFVVGDLLSGKLKRKAKALAKKQKRGE